MMKSLFCLSILFLLKFCLIYAEGTLYGVCPYVGLEENIICCANADCTFYSKTQQDYDGCSTGQIVCPDDKFCCYDNKECAYVCTDPVPEVECPKEADVTCGSESELCRSDADCTNKGKLCCSGSDGPCCQTPKLVYYEACPTDAEATCDSESEICESDEDCNNDELCCYGSDGPCCLTPKLVNYGSCPSQENYNCAPCKGCNGVCCQDANCQYTCKTYDQYIGCLNFTDNYNYKDTCQGGLTCCYSECGFKCTNPTTYLKDVCPEIRNLNIYETVTICESDADCSSSWEKCCPTTCSDVKACTWKIVKKAECPDQAETCGSESCTSEADCFDNDELCCPGSDGQCCQTPKLVDFDY